MLTPEEFTAILESRTHRHVTFQSADGPDFEGFFKWVEELVGRTRAYLLEEQRRKLIADGKLVEMGPGRFAMNDPGPRRIPDDRFAKVPRITDSDTGEVFYPDAPEIRKGEFIKSRTPEEIELQAMRDAGPVRRREVPPEETELDRLIAENKGLREEFVKPSEFEGTKAANEDLGKQLGDEVARFDQDPPF
jgi:hypothetical protein